MVAKRSSYIQDTTDFINRLRGLPQLPPECSLVTLDVFRLYTNIPHQEEITACEEFLGLTESPMPPLLTSANLSGIFKCGGGTSMTSLPYELMDNHLYIPF